VHEDPARSHAGRREHDDFGNLRRRDGLIPERGGRCV
jgi:hypothetical protein